MNHASISFDDTFEKLTSHRPFPWQQRLFEEWFSKGDVPGLCNLPTGLGKTSVIAVWLIALAVAADAPRGKRLPRRLVYVVNRRTVVDQATREAEKLRQKLGSAGLLEPLTRLCALPLEPNQLPLGISTLRGQFADNGEWFADPARPAIIVGTVDMIGSRLLFSAYGRGFKARPLHAGLLGQDALIVHDEAHLTPAFSELLRGIAHEQERSGEPRRVQVMELSATQRGSDGDAFRLSPEDETDEQTGRLVKQRLDAKKWLRLHECDNVVAGLVERAKSHIEAPTKMLVYVRSPQDAQKVAEEIRKELGDAADERVALLTGTIRGYERDRLVSENPVYRAMLDHEAAQHTVFLVSTSAGEVGIDLDADHMICDLTTLDSMIQRLGRVNRRGGADREACVDVVWTEKDAKGGDKLLEKAVAATLGSLQHWVEANAGAGDSHPHPHPGLLVSPRNLRMLIESLSEQERESAFSPKPNTPPLTDILLDNWSLTSIDDMPGRPEVAAYLHGLTADPPETYVVWRKEVALLHEAGADESTLTDWFRTCRIEARERLRDRTDRVKKALEGLLKAHRKRNADRDFPVVVLDERGRAEWSRLSEVAADESKLRYRTVVHPAEAGGLDEHGMLDGKATEPIRDIDVAETAARLGRRERWLEVRIAGSEPQRRRLLSAEVAEPPSELRERDRIPLKGAEEGAEDESESTELVLFELPAEAARESPETARVIQPLADHTDAIVKHMDPLADRLGLAPDIKDALLWAGRWHDRGKDRSVWQRYCCNREYRNGNGQAAWAKSEKYLPGRALGGYRHEFGSLLEAMTDEELRKQPERDLVMHLIAAHHGWARPHFEPRAFDNEGPVDGTTGERRPPTTAANEQALVEAMQRFGRLQQRFGRWGLAWLESLLRCADIAASKQAVASAPAPVSSDRPVPEEAGA